MPNIHGSTSVDGIREPLTIYRDRYGIPLVDARTEADRAFGVGFCHGQDRAFQLEILHRVARGRVAELVGPAALPLDRLARRIGFFRAAQEQWPLIDKDLRDDLEAYSAGVNAGRTIVPHELALLGGPMLPWDPIDCLAIAKVLSFKLAANWDAEMMRLKVLSSDGPAALAALDPVYAAHHPVIVPPGMAAGPALDRLTEEINTFLHWAGGGSGSNNWVVAGARTQSGRPLLANDPHLDASLPSHWYLIAARGPEQMVAGASLVGGPSVLAGHNGHLAWGLTAGLIDNTDLFIETINFDEDSVRQGESWVPCDVVQEIIAVKGSAPVTERVLITPRGPIVSPAFHDTPQMLSLCATWLRPRKVRGLFTLFRARDFASFREECRFWPVSAQSLVYADAAGNIGYQLLGDAPVRRGGPGLVPQPGSEERHTWEQELLPFEQIPHALNPPEGWLASANNRHTPEGVGPYLGSDFIDGYRAARLAQLLPSRTDWTVALFQHMQMDQRTLAWEELRPFVLSLEGVPAELRDWDGIVAADSRAALLYEIWLSSLIRRVAQRLAPQSWEWVVGRGVTALTPYNFGCYRRTSHLVRLLQQDSAAWQSEMQAALKDALATPGTWGDRRTLILHHPLSRAGGLLGRAMRQIFNLGPIPWGGDADVLNNASVLPLAPLAATDNIASMRMVVDVGRWENSRWALPGGQSGNPFSPHYRDLFALWQKGQGVPITFSVEQLSSEQHSRLELLPRTPAHAASASTSSSAT